MYCYEGDLVVRDAVEALLLDGQVQQSENQDHYHAQKLYHHEAAAEGLPTNQSSRLIRYSRKTVAKSSKLSHTLSGSLRVRVRK